MKIFFLLGEKGYFPNI